MRTLSTIFLISLFAVAAVSQTSLKAGEPAPLFSSTALDGADFDLRDLRGKVVVLTFWSTNCAICQEEIPKLNQFTGRFDENKVVFLAATTENEDRVNAYVKKHPFGFHILPNSFGIVLQYTDRDREGNLNMQFPSYFLIDQTGQINYRATGWDKAEKINSEISRLLAKQ